MISYTPLTLPPPQTTATSIAPFSLALEPIVLPRRDLFDVRFQLLNETTSEDAAADSIDAHLEFIDAPSDLLPGIYEGGLKTWECSVDLAAYLSRSGIDIRGKRILEVRFAFCKRSDSIINADAGINELNSAVGMRDCYTVAVSA